MELGPKRHVIKSYIRFQRILEFRCWLSNCFVFLQFSNAHRIFVNSSDNGRNLVFTYYFFHQIICKHFSPFIFVPPVIEVEFHCRLCSTPPPTPTSSISWSGNLVWRKSGKFLVDLSFGCKSSFIVIACFKSCIWFFRTFDVRMYECVGAFDWIGWGVLDRLKDHGVIYLYAVVHCGWLLQIVVMCISRVM